MHARGIPPASNVTITDIEDYCATFEKKMGSFLQPRADLTDDEAGKLGMKNEEDEVEKFVQVIFSCWTKSVAALGTTFGLLLLLSVISKFIVNII